MYKTEIEFLQKYEDANNAQNERTLLTEEEISKLSSEHPKLPLEFIEYLKQIGWGAFRECQYMIHEPSSLLSDFADMYYLADEPPEGDLDNYVVFGDGFDGDLGLINLNTQKVAVYLHESTEIYQTEQGFKLFINEMMGIGENGQDTFT